MPTSPPNATRASATHRSTLGVASSTVAFAANSLTARVAYAAQAPAQPHDSLAQAQAILRWLQGVDLCHSRGDSAVQVTPWLHLARDAEALAGRRDALLAAVPGLTAGQATLVVGFLVQRAHAEHSDAAATRLPLVRALSRALDDLAADKPYAKATRPRGADHLLHLSAAHYDGCLFDPNHVVGRGGQGSFHVGLTKFNHAVAIKGVAAGQAPTPSLPSAVVLRPGNNLLREAESIRSSSQYDYLQLLDTPQLRYIVMPLFNGDLQQHAPAFFNIVDPAAQARDANDAWPTHGLAGARYVLGSLLQSVQTLHEDARVVHQDIKATNIFVQRDQQRFCLGDFGVCAPLDAHGTSSVRGYTREFAAPEQVAHDGRRIGAKADIFALGATMFHLLLTSCEPVANYRRQHFPEQRGRGLLPPGRAWREIHESHRDYLFDLLADDADGLPAYSLVAGAPPRSYAAHFRSVHDSIDAFDAPLGALLRTMVAHEPDARPSAREALATLQSDALDHGIDPAQLHGVWRGQVARFSPHVGDQLRALTRIKATFNRPQQNEVLR